VMKEACVALMWFAVSWWFGWRLKLTDPGFWIGAAAVFEAFAAISNMVRAVL